MATITDIKSRICQMAPAPFQEFCDTLLHKKGYGIVHGYGMKAGTGKTTIGNPDTYFRKENGKYVFVAYTTQVESIYSKLKDDIDKCLDCQKTGLEITEIEEIICCHTSSNLSAGDDKKLHDYCESKGVSLVIWGIDEIANQVYHYAPFMAKEFFGLSIDTNQIMSIDEFVKVYDANKLSAPINTIFQYREDEKANIIEALKVESVVVLVGKPGVGKTRLALEAAREFVNIEEYELFCVKNNSLSLYEDLITRIEDCKNYLFLVDDANELDDIKHILAYVNQRQNYKMKIIATVRDYAKEKLMDSIQEYTESKEIQVSPFSEEEIIGFLKENVKITDEFCIKQIIRIAEGNPRHAYMAGKLLKAKNDLSKIRDASQIYAPYYKNYIQSTLGQDNTLYFTVGILSVINKVILKDLTAIEELLNLKGMTNDEFIDSINKLSDLGVVEIIAKHIAKLSDQCFADFILYDMFFLKKKFSFAKVLEVGYKHFREGVIMAIDTMINIFGTEDIEKYCKNEIKVVWNNMKKSQDPFYEEFVQDFHIFQPIEAFVLAQEKIEKMEVKPFQPCKVKRYCESTIFFQEDEIVKLLKGYSDSKYVDCAMKLLLEYSSKTEESMRQGFEFLERYYGINEYSKTKHYKTQIRITSILKDEVYKNNNYAMYIGLYWALYSLQFSVFNYVPRKSIYEIARCLILHNTEGLNKYREECWNILILLSKYKEWRDEIIQFLTLYLNCVGRDLQLWRPIDELKKEFFESEGKEVVFPSELGPNFVRIFITPDKDIAIKEAKYVEHLLSELQSNDIDYIIAVDKIIENAEELGIKYDRKCRRGINSFVLELYQLLKKNNIDPQLAHNSEEDRCYRLCEYGKNIKLSDIHNIIKIVNGFLSGQLKDSITRKDIQQGFEEIVRQLDEKYLQEFSKEFMQFGNNIKPQAIVELLQNKIDSDILFNEIKSSSFSPNNELMFSFFDTLPERKVNKYFLEEFIEFIEKDIEFESDASGYESLRALDKFWSIEKNIYPIISLKIYESQKGDNYHLFTYLESLFEGNKLSPKDLLERYSNNIGLLQNIYFLLLERGKFYDLDGKYLVEFLTLGESWLHRYSEVLWKEYAMIPLNQIDSDRKHNVLWKSADYIKKINYIFDQYTEEKFYKERLGHVFRGLFINNPKDALVKEHQEKWLIQKIKNNSSVDWINLVFKYAFLLEDRLKKSAINTFIKTYPDFDLFSKISLWPDFDEFDRITCTFDEYKHPKLPENWEYSYHTEILAYQEYINFLESLEAIFKDIQYLKHWEKIKNVVEELKGIMEDAKVKAKYSYI